ncbi:unnamed protein product [Periconia digitata]|uniref:Uncharacterized protein n=1 Tax=Periconia digitata TaxID=1303443 RepID=A0A9W4XNY0_9PLEO|nr:unnamed protein product [Periconia digitata]
MRPHQTSWHLVSSPGQPTSRRLHYTIHSRSEFGRKATTENPRASIQKLVTQQRPRDELEPTKQDGKLFAWSLCPTLLTLSTLFTFIFIFLSFLPLPSGPFFSFYSPPPRLTR